MNRAEFLAKVSIFSSMKKPDLDRIAALTRYLLFRERDIIIREGEKDGRLFLIVKGEVEIIKDLGGKNQRWVRNLGPFSYFGEMALVDNLGRSASVIARTYTEVLSLDQLNLYREIKRYPDLATELLQTLSRRVREIEKAMVRILGGILPICANCKKIREENGAWTSLEEYISEHSQAEFTHGICPECAEKLYPGRSGTSHP